MSLSNLQNLATESPMADVQAGTLIPNPKAVCHLTYLMLSFLICKMGSGNPAAHIPWQIQYKIMSL